MCRHMTKPAELQTRDTQCSYFTRDLIWEELLKHYKRVLGTREKEKNEQISEGKNVKVQEKSKFYKKKVLQLWKNVTF